MKISERWVCYFEDERKKSHYYLAYTFVFLALSFFVFWWFIASDRSLIRRNDGWDQHFRALLYYSDYLKQIFKSLFVDHQLVLPQWNFSIGEGNDILNTLHYYVIGDPIAFLSVLIPTQLMHYFFSFACILRMYLAGIAFSMLAMYTGCRNRYGILAGALSYGFCFWALLNAARHPYFLNPLIYFPLIILSVEKIIRAQRPYLFVGMVALSAASNFYFFYMIALLTAIYTLVRLGFLYRRDIKRTIAVVFRIGLLALLGTCIAGIIFFPVIMMVLQDARMSVEQPFFLFYPLEYYTSMPATAISSKTLYWACMGFSAPVILAWFVLFLERKKNRMLKTLFVISMVIFTFPICGRLLNGMSYMTNRWSWAFALLSAYILTWEWDELISLRQKRWFQIALCSAAYLTVCMVLEFSKTKAAFAALVILFVSLLAIHKNLLFRRKTLRQMVSLALLCVSIINVAFWKYAPAGENFSGNAKINHLVEMELQNNEAAILQELTEPANIRYSGRKIEENVNLTSGISSTQYFWTLSHPYVVRYRTSMELPDSTSYSYTGYDDRTALLALSSVSHYVTRRGDDEGLPYGYELIDHYYAPVEASDELTKDEYSIYENMYALPLGYCYEYYITKEEWESLDPVQKQEIQLEAAYINRETELLSEYDVDMMDYTLPYEIECLSDAVSRTDMGFVTTEENAKIRLDFEGNYYSETYLRIQGLEMEETAEYDLYSDDERVDPLNLYNRTDWEMLSPQKQKAIYKAKWFQNGPETENFILESSVDKVKNLEYIPAGGAFSNGRKDFIVNMGYMEEPATSITLTFPKRGIYTIDALEVYNVPMDAYDLKIENLQMNVLGNIEVGTDRVSGELEVEMPQLLCMTIPYSTGWRAYVDGEETEILLVNERYLGVVVSEGKHLIEFAYQMPYGMGGTILSLLGVAAFLLLIALTERKYHSPKNNRHFAG